jgi:NAD-dependent dihydropyrimidine dehydrogenase PreA subunit
MSKRISFVLSQGQSKNPSRRRLEEDIIAGLMFEAGFEVTVIPHLYDLKPESTGMLALQGISGDMIVCSWMFERAAHWILDRNRICGHPGTTLLVNEADDEDDEEEEEEPEEELKPRVIDQRQVPNRRIYCFDLKTSNRAEAYIEEARRILSELSVPLVRLGDGNGSTRLPTSNQLQRFDTPQNSTSLSKNGDGLASPATPPVDESSNVPPSTTDSSPSEGQVTRIEERAPRRWYPVIDYSRCTNCLECIDFCLFGVYGVDRIDTILVEQPDNCRKGCPACSRVCPENAIIFPQHKTPAIAGSPETGSSLKIDLSQLFGAPDKGKSAAEVAADERDQQLALAGRQTVGMQGLDKRQPRHKRNRKRDKLDELVDQLDQFDL